MFFGLHAILSALIAVVMINAAIAETVKERFQRAFSEIQRNDYAAAAEIFRSLAEEGSAPAQFNLGNMYLGPMLPKNYGEAAKWLGRAAEQGDDMAQGRLQRVVFRGMGCPSRFSTGI